MYPTKVNLRGGESHFPGVTRAPEAPGGGDIGEGLDCFKDWKSVDLTRQWAKGLANYCGNTFLGLRPGPGGPPGRGYRGGA